MKISVEVRMLKGSKLSEDLDKVKHALEEHLSTINENTSEIQALFDFLQDIETKMEKVSQRLDQLQLNQGQPLPKPAITPLNQIEKKIFLNLYTEEAPLSVNEIAVRSSLSPSIVMESIGTLTQKGVPLSRNFCQDQMFFKLDPGFKERQAKENLINLSLQSFMG